MEERQILVDKHGSSVVSTLTSRLKVPGSIPGTGKGF